MEEFLKAFEKVIGYDDEKRKLMPICDMMRNPDKYARLGVVMPSGAILQGPPGYGKTLMCKCFIDACGVPYFVCRKDKADGDFVNYMKKCFDDAAENAPAIVFLDDMDKFANEDQDHKNAEEYVAVQACIDNVKGKNVFVIATTNEMYNLPNSLLRAGRFDINIEMCGLEKDDQIKLIKFYLQDKPVADDLSIENIWHILGGETSCAELEKIINDAAIKVAFDNNKAKIGYEDIVDACLRHHFDKVDDKPPTERNRITAVHEAGHTIVSEILDPNSVGLVSIQASHYSFSGITHFIRGNYSSNSYVFRENRIVSLLAGKAATEVALNVKDCGSMHDIREAKISIKRLRDDDGVYGFENMADALTGSMEQCDRADNVLNAELNRLYAEAKRIIFEHRDFLDAVATALLEKKTIFAEDIQAIKKSLDLA